MIVDEHGSLEGVVTPVDILTAIAGELPEAASEEAPEAVMRDDQSWLMDGRMPIDDVERLLSAGKNIASEDCGFTRGGMQPGGRSLEFG